MNCICVHTLIPGDGLAEDSLAGDAVTTGDGPLPNDVEIKITAGTHSNARAVIRSKEGDFYK